MLPANCGRAVEAQYPAKPSAKDDVTLCSATCGSDIKGSQSSADPQALRNYVHLLRSSPLLSRS